MGPSISIQVDPGEDYSILQLYQLVQILRYLEIMECIQMDGVIVKDFVALSVNKMDAATDLLCGRRQNEIGCSKDGALHRNAVNATYLKNKFLHRVPMTRSSWPQT